MADLLRMYENLDTRVTQLEGERGHIAADISSLRAEVHTNNEWFKSTLTRIEENLEERPSRAEIVTATTRKSFLPKIDVDGKKLTMSFVGVSPWLMVVIVLVVGAVVALWLKK